MSIHDEKPWLSRYDQDQPAEISLEFTDALAMFRASVSRNPDGDIIRYFGGRITVRELDELRQLTRARTSVSTARVSAGSITSSISNAAAVLSAWPRRYCSATSSS